MLDFDHAPAWSHPLAGRRIGVLGREGAGRTTLAVLLARTLAERGYEVCLVNADSVGDGPSRAFGLDRPPRSLLRHLGGSGGGGAGGSSGEKYVGHTVTIRLSELPDEFVGRPDEGIYLLTLGKAGGRASEEEGEDPVVGLARDLRIVTGREKPLTLLELNAEPGSSPSDLLARLDWALVVVDPTFESVDIAAEVEDRWQRSRGRQTVAGAELPSIPGADDPHWSSLKGILAVLNHMPDPETEQYFATAVSSQASLEPIGAVREDWDVSLAGERGQPLPEHKAERRIGKIVDHLEEAEREILTGRGP